MAGELGDGLIVTSGKKRELYTEDLLPGFERGARAAGRDPARLERMIEVKLSFDTTQEKALWNCRPWAALALPEEAKRGVEDPREMEKRAKEGVANAHTRFIATADPDEACVFHLPAEEQKRSIDLVGKEILPRLRRDPAT